MFWRLTASEYTTSNRTRNRWSAHQVCETVVGYVLARWFGSSDEERTLLESTALVQMRQERLYPVLIGISRGNHA
jgi:hypothetical protein